jgi:flavodoxin
MQGLIVYYSWVGNTDVAAKEIAKLTGFELRRIEEKKTRKLSGIMAAAFGAMFGFNSAIKPMDFEMDGYDCIFLGAQVWARKTAPAINSFLNKANFAGKSVYLFITKGDPAVPQGVIDSITQRIQKKGGKVMDALSLTTPWDPQNNTPVSPETINSEISEWIKRIGV